MRNKILSILTGGLCLLCFHLSAEDPELLKLIHREKLSLFADRSIYLAGDTVLFGLCTSDHPDGRPLFWSSVAYVEILDRHEQVHAQARVALEDGKGAAWIRLPSRLDSDHYYMRAYTSWMKNAGPAAFAYHLLTVINPESPPLERVEDLEEGGEGESPSASHPGTGPLLVWNPSSDTGTLTFRAGPEYEGPDQELLFRCLHKGIPVWEEKFSLDRGNKHFVLQDRVGAARLVECVVADPGGTILAGRLVWLPGKENHALEAVMEKETYHPGEMIELQVQAKGKQERGGALILSCSVLPEGDREGLQWNHPGIPLCSPVLLESWLKGLDSGSMPSWHALEKVLGDAYELHQSLNPEARDGKYLPLFPPEPSGPLIQGMARSISMGEVLAGASVACTLPGSAEIFRTATTGPAGTFFLQPPPGSRERDLVLSPLPDKEAFRVEYTGPWSRVFPDFFLPPLLMDEKLLAYISRLHINRQVREAFYTPGKQGELAGDTTVASGRSFYGEASEVVELEEFIRLPVMEEIFRELVSSVVLMREEDSYRIGVLDPLHRDLLGPSPLILLDGIPVNDHREVMELDPLSLARVKVVDARYLSGEYIADGIIELESAPGKKGDQKLPEQCILAEQGMNRWMPGLSPDTERRARSGEGGHLPDFRDLVFWNPDLKVPEGGSLRVSFPAPGDPGAYRVCLQGLDRAGNPFLRPYSFLVDAGK